MVTEVTTPLVLVCPEHGDVGRVRQQSNTAGVDIPTHCTVKRTVRRSDGVYMWLGCGRVLEYKVER